jgi:hypothetical protein
MPDRGRSGVPADAEPSRPPPRLTGVTRVRFALAALLALAAPGCFAGSSSGPPPPPGTVSGLVVVGAGPPAVSDNGGIADLRPVRAAPVVVAGRTAAGARIVRRSATDRLGRFRVRLPAGRYSVTATILPGAPAQPHRSVVVRPGRVDRIRLTAHVP